jgi:hypothetical protein
VCWSRLRDADQRIHPEEAPLTTTTATTTIGKHGGPAREELRIEVVAAAYVQLGQPDSALGYLQQRASAHSDIESLMSPASLQGLQDRRIAALDTLTAYLTASGQRRP